MTKYVKLYLRFSRWILAAVILLTLFFATQAAQIDVDFTLERLFQSEDEEMEHYRAFQKDFGDDGAMLYIGMKTLNVLGPESQEILARIGDDIGKLTDVKGVFSLHDALRMTESFPLPEHLRHREIRTNPLFVNNLISRDGKSTGIWVVLDAEVRTEKRRSKVLEGVDRILRREEKKEEAHFFVAGLPTIEHEYVKLTVRDILTFLPLAVGVFLALLCLYFRNLLGTVLPLLTIVFAWIWILGALRLMGIPISVLTSIVPNLVLTIGIADSIHVLSRHQEDLAKYEDKKEALSWTILTMLGACFLTTLTTSIGFLSLLTTNVEAIREFGWITAFGILVVFIVSMAFIPAVLDNLKPFRGRVLDSFANEFSDRMMGRVAWVNRNAPGIVVLLCAAVLAVSVLGILRIRQESSWLQDIRSENQVHKAHRFFNENLGSVFTIDMRFDGKPGEMRDVDVIRRIDEFAAKIGTWSWDEDSKTRAGGALSYPQFLREINRLRLVAGKILMQPKRAEAILADEGNRRLPKTPKEVEACFRTYESYEQRFNLEIRLITPDYSSCRVTVRVENMNTMALDHFAASARTLAKRIMPGLKLRVSGKSWLAKRAMDKVIGSMLSSLGIAAVLIFLTMSLLFKSWRVGLISMVPNLMPMFVTAGFMGWIGIHLNFSTVTIFSISLGIAVDNTIHYLARYRLEIVKDHDHVEAMNRTLKGVGRPMVFTTILLIMGFGAILTSNFAFTFHFGLLGGFTIIIALLADLFVTPSLFLIIRPRISRWQLLEEKWKKVDERLSGLLQKKEKDEPPTGH